MGNSNTKESRPSEGPDGPDGQNAANRRAANPSGTPAEGSRHRHRMGRSELSFLSLGNTSSARDRDRSDAPFERRETRQEREARKLERERIAREKERERSLREEHVDGGYLVTLGTYTGTEDFSKPVVRQLQIERKMAPFWRGLNDYSDSWAEHQIVAAARGLPIPAADETPDPDLIPQPPPPTSSSSQNLQNLTVPMGPRTLSAASDRSGSGPGSGPGSSLPSPVSPAPSKGLPFKPRAKALAAALSVGSRNTSSADLAPKETSLPHDPFVNGQPIEVFLYKDAIDCPICFLSYPPYLNRTRCCDQPICSECFVQIKRTEPHLPEHHPDGEVRDPHEGLAPDDPPEMLISEPSSCPYCQVHEFGVTYDAPPFRRGVSYSSSSTNLASSTAMSSQTSINSTLQPGSPHQTGRRRTHSLSANAPNVITTDRVRPDWATKLASARAHQARRSAAATALHTAAFLVGTGGEPRSILRPSRFSRRNTGTSSPAAADRAAGNGAEGAAATISGSGDPAAPTAEGGRRNRMEELEDMMFMEAVRLSLAAEEDRRYREEKHYRKEAKKRLKEERKAQKKQTKDPYSGAASGASGSSLSLGLGRRRGNSGASNLRVEATVQGASHASKSGDSPPSLASPTTESRDKDETGNDKGKGVDRGPQESPSEPSSSAGALPIPAGPSRGGSHLRQMSNASSIGSSVGDSPSGSYMGPDGTDLRSGGAGLAGSSDDADHDNGTEPMFNFRSLAEMVGVNIEDGSSNAAENTDGESAACDRPLSQVKEEEKEDGEAEHVEGEAQEAEEAEPPAQLDTLAVNDTTPELVITPNTPAPVEDGAANDKQLGHHDIVEHASQITQ